MFYLFIGQDSLSKDIQFKKLKEQVLPQKVENFNLDILYSRELTLKELQERLLCLPVEAKSRLILIKEAQALKDDSEDFLLQYAKKPHADTVLVLDFDRWDGNNEFLNRIQRYAKIFRFKERVRPDAFTLSRYIVLKRPAEALWILNQLLKDGERPERILGGLRYAWERDNGSALEMKKRFKSLLDCDIEIKTGKLKPSLALEKLVISLCGLGSA
jgi:DNA polymerase III delta subunit